MRTESLTVDNQTRDAAALRLRQAGMSFGRGAQATQAIRDLSFDVAPGEFVSVLDPSGCGKSTLIGIVAGLTPLTSSEITVDGLAVQRPGADRAVVFQHHALFPWKTALGNVEFGLRMRGLPRGTCRQQASELLREVGLGEFLGHYPAQLSGGMQQRVSLARVLVNRPRVLLMDEPFSALDAQTRLQMQTLLLKLWETYRMTVLFVTHDIDEAIFLSDRALVMGERPGRIKAELPIALPRPRTTEMLAAAEFMNLKRCCLDWTRPEGSSGSVRSSAQSFSVAHEASVVNFETSKRDAHYA